MINPKPLILAVIILLLSVLVFAGNFTISGEDSKASCIYSYLSNRNWGEGDYLWVGQGWADRFARTLYYPSSLADSMRDIGTATWDSAIVGLVFTEDEMTWETADSVFISVFKITEPAWEEGNGTNHNLNAGFDTCGVMWDSANATDYTGCAGSPTDWSSDGGDHSATRETFGSHADSILVRGSETSSGDTIYFYISGATIADTMGNKAGLLFKHVAIGGSGGFAQKANFNSDDYKTASRKPFITVYYTLGAPPDITSQIIIIEGD